MQIWATGEALSQKELDCFRERRAEKRIDLGGKGWQRPGQAELEKKPGDFSRASRKKRGNCWFVMNWGLGERMCGRGTRLCVMNGMASLYVVNSTGKI